ncbi:hypothetical protein OSTOST_13349 [Ostertagia ostertagi]
MKPLITQLDYNTVEGLAPLVNQSFRLGGEFKYKISIGGFLNDKKTEIPDFQHFNAACTKRDVAIHEDYWLSRERGEVVYSDSYCNYYVVETASGYTLIRAYGSYKPYEGSIVYGDFSYTGTSDMYNRSSGVVFTGTVTDYWLSYYEAQDLIDYYCPLPYEKISVNLGKRKTITEEDIEEFVGLQSAIAKKDVPKAIRIIQYFEANPKAAPIQFILPSLYGFFSKVFMVHGAGATDEKGVAAAIGVNPFFAKDYLQAARTFDYAGVEKILLLLHTYNMKSLGVNSTGVEDASLLKEMVIKMAG